MMYLLKASIVLTLFYVVYLLLLQRETYFNANRFFLIFGIVFSFLLPLIPIPDYVEVAPIKTTFEQIVPVQEDLPDLVATDHLSDEVPIEASYDIMTVLKVIYVAGLSFFFFKLLLSFVHLKRVFSRGKKLAKQGCYHYTTNEDIAPFSFFHHIVYNPSKFDIEELDSIIKHEMVHAKQYHSIDLLLSQLAVIIIWFNPLIWFYKKALQQNLEFIADRGAQNTVQYQIDYQELLLKSSFSSNHLKLVNSFNTSLIKKRIIMLQKSKSKSIQKLKLLVIIPLLGLFLMAFNRETIYVPVEEGDIGEELFDLSLSPNKDIEVLFDKDMTDKNLVKVKEMLLEQGVTFTYSKIKRNKKGEITGLKFEFEAEGKSVNYNVKSSDAIEPFYFKMTGGSLSVNTFADSSSEPKIKTSASSKNTFVILNNDTEDKVVEGTEKEDIDKAYVSKQRKKHSYSVIDSSKTDIIAYESAKSSRDFVMKNKDPLVIIDGKESTFDVLRIISPNSIQSLTVLKDKNATSLYGQKGENGVLVVVTEQGQFDADNYPKAEEISIYTDVDGKVKLSGKNAEKAMIIFNGRAVTLEEINQIDKSQLKSVNIIKGEAAVGKYGPEASNGVVVILSKPKEKWSISMPTITKLVKENDDGTYTITERVATYDYEEEAAKKPSHEFILTHEADDEFLEHQTKSLAKVGIEAKFKRVKRDNSGKIIGIKITLTSKGQKSSSSWKSDNAIPDIVMGKTQSGDLILRALKN